jgi:hypothetical protein
MRKIQQVTHFVFLFFYCIHIQKIHASQPNHVRNNGSKMSTSQTAIHKTPSIEAEKYSSLPHTVFAPDGRLYNVEKNARKSSDPNDLSSSLVLAMQFGKKYAIVLSTRHQSPLLPIKTTQIKSKQDEEQGEKDVQYKPLWSHVNQPHSTTQQFLSMHSSLTVLPCDTIIGVGGSAPHSIAFHHFTILKSIYLSTLLSQEDNVFATHRIQGTILASMIAQNIANQIQKSTQSMASDGGSDGNGMSLLPLSVLVVGKDRHQNVEIWRCDPTGQFWKCHATAVGRNAGAAELVILNKAHEYLKKQSPNENEQDPFEYEELIKTISQSDVENYLQSLSFDEAVILSCECIVRALRLQGIKDDDDENGVDELIHRLGLQGVVLSKGKDGRVEHIHPQILRNALKPAVSLDTAISSL